MKAIISFEDTDTGQVDVRIEFDPPARFNQSDGTPALALAATALEVVQRKTAQWAQDDHDDFPDDYEV